MSDAIEPTTWRRLRHTPLRDVIRGRVTGRLDWRRRIAASGLPVAAQVLIERVVGRTRLWRIEKVAVAEELMAHFADGIDAGEPAEEMIGRFGDEARAAKLIRRGKIRNRPLGWHALRWAGRGLAAVIVLYGLAAARYFTGSPSPSVDYVAQLNNTIASVPESDRGWPVYLPVMKKVQALEMDKKTSRRWTLLSNAVPGSRHWGGMTQWLTDNAADLEQIRIGAAKPRLGFVLGPTGTARDVMSPQACAQMDDALISVLLPHLNDMRGMSNLLQSDGRLACTQGDGPRLRRNIEALLNLQRQMHSDPGRFLVCDLVGIGLRNQGLQLLDEALSLSPALLSDADLVSLAHQISTPKRAADLLTFSGERLQFHDLLQRVYTDDGHGDGRLTPAGAERLLRYQPIAPGDKPEPPTQWLGPAAMLVMASRQDMRQMYDQLIDYAETQLAKPMRDTNWDEHLRRLASLKQSGPDSIRYWPVANLAPALNFTQRTAEICVGRQEGLTVAIALELHRRRQGVYPQTLAELSPQLLPAVPADRITGEPVKYRLVDGKPVVYSVGANRRDDGGALFRQGRVLAHRAAEWGNRATGPALEADWVLYPYPVEPIEELEDNMVAEENIRSAP